MPTWLIFWGGPKLECKKSPTKFPRNPCRSCITFRSAGSWLTCTSVLAGRSSLTFGALRTSRHGLIAPPEVSNPLELPQTQIEPTKEGEWKSWVELSHNFQSMQPRHSSDCLAIPYQVLEVQIKEPQVSHFSHKTEGFPNLKLGWRLTANASSKISSECLRFPWQGMIVER